MLNFSTTTQDFAVNIGKSVEGFVVARLFYWARILRNSEKHALPANTVTIFVQLINFTKAEASVSWPIISTTRKT